MTLLPAYAPTFYIPSMSERSLLELGDLLKGYIKRSGKTQRRIAEESGIPSPTYLSQMANARVNWVASEYFRPLTVALGLSVAEIADLNPDLIVTDQYFPASNGSPIPPVVAPMDVIVEVPQELQNLIDQYGDQPGYEALKNHKTVQILAVRRAYMGEEDNLQTVEDWRDYFLDMRRWLPK